MLAAHPDGLFAGEVQFELSIPASTLSHHLERLKQEGLVTVQREGTYLGYTANADALRELVSFLVSECCTRNRVVSPDVVFRLCK